MDLTLTPDEEAFRDDVRTWLEANHPGPEPDGDGDVDAAAGLGVGVALNLNLVGKSTDVRHASCTS